MVSRGDFKRKAVLLMGSVFILMFSVLYSSAESTYPETIRVIQALYQDELQALHNYIAFKENQIGHRNIFRGAHERIQGNTG